MLKNNELIEEFKKSLSATIKSIGKYDGLEINYVKENPSIVGNTINLTEPNIESIKNNLTYLRAEADSLALEFRLHSKELHQNYINKRRIVFLGISSAILLTLHSIFLGIKFDNDLYKLFRRVVMLSFIIFELIAQAYLIKFFYEIRHKLNNHINITFLKIKRILITFLIIISIITLPFLPFDNFKFLKHAIEWNVFLGVILFYLLTHLMWKNNTSL